MDEIQYARFSSFVRNVTRNGLNYGRDRQVANYFKDRYEEATRTNVCFGSAMIVNFYVRHVLGIAFARGIRVTSALFKRVLRRNCLFFT